VSEYLDSVPVKNFLGSCLQKYSQNKNKGFLLAAACEELENTLFVEIVSDSSVTDSCEHLRSEKKLGYVY
jgi:hypothetical protein